MPTYRAISETWLSHECRKVPAGETFTTDFPLVKGDPMKLGANLELVPEEEQAEPEPKKRRPAA